MAANFQFDKKWRLQPIGGDTGKAYMGIKASEKVFIKRNSSPFLAALSREGITPKLVWTKRTGDGDVLTAQEWLEGSLLKASEMGERADVIRILQHLHRSESLKQMLERVRGPEKEAFDFLMEYATDLPKELKNNHYLVSVFRYLEDHIPMTTSLRACHGDPVNDNWLLSEEDRLYLVDWDSTMLADPAVDLGIILGRYIPYNEWVRWLNLYGFEPSSVDLEKIYWYSGIDFLNRIKTHYLEYDYQGMNREILLLKKLYAY